MTAKQVAHFTLFKTVCSSRGHAYVHAAGELAVKTEITWIGYTRDARCWGKAHQMAKAATPYKLILGGSRVAALIKGGLRPIGLGCAVAADDRVLLQPQDSIVCFRLARFLSW